MGVRVACDISVLGTNFDRFDSKHGIYRVIEEVLTELCRRGDLEMTGVSLCGDDPLTDSVRALLYFESKEPAIPCSFSPTFRSRWGLTKFYNSIFHATLAGKLDRLPSLSARAIYLRCAQSLIYRLVCIYRFDKLCPVFDPESFDVFHCPHPKLPSKDITGNLPRVLTIYDLIPVIRPDFVFDWFAASFQGILDKIDVRRDWVTCISEFTKLEFCEHTGMAPERVFVTPLAASSLFRPITDSETIVATRSRYGVPEGNYFLSLVAPQPRKNLAHLIRCFFRLLDEHHLPDTYLVLAGSKDLGWMYDEIFTAAESSLKHRSRVIFTGYVADEDLAALYSGAVALVYPSLYEGFGLPALEAMACGTAVITSNTTALPEVVGNAGLVVDPTDADELCEAMLTVVEDDEVRQELGRRGLKRAAEFSWERCAEETARVYHAAAGERLRMV